MDKSTNSLDVPRDAHLKIELKTGGKEQARQLQRVATSKVQTTQSTQSQHFIPNMLSRSPTVESPPPQKGDKTSPPRKLQANQTAKSELSMSQSAKQGDCLLLDYQSQLRILEKLNRRSSRRARKLPRRKEPDRLQSMALSSNT